MVRGAGACATAPTACRARHGDFHPWNLLFREGTDFSVLDRSRGEWGEPADDVAALGDQLPLLRPAQGRPRTASAAWPSRSARSSAPSSTTYIEASGDDELLEVLPPFLAFRALVIAHPRWYPGSAGPGCASDLAPLRALADAARPRFDPADVSGSAEWPP